MKLMYHTAEPGNFGDDLNTWLWRELLPRDFFDGCSAELFYGIGTLLSRDMPPQPRKIIFGSGTGYKAPPVIDDTYRVYFVRGPLTARALHLDATQAISDPAYLILTTDQARQEINHRYDVSVIPHYLSMGMVDWETMARTTGLNIIDPSDSPLAVITRIRESKLVLTESLHGAILADAFRVKWIPIACSYRFLRFKWLDWCHSVRVNFSPVDLPPLFQGAIGLEKRLTNYVRNKLGGAGLGPAVWRKRPYRHSSAKELDLFASALMATANNHPPSLSKDRELCRIVRQMSDQLDRLRESHRR
jgi:succinoglycan biosynthesis protein ExoV